MTQLIISLLLWLGTPEAQVTPTSATPQSAESTQDIGSGHWSGNGKAQSGQNTTMIGSSDWEW
ncbi:MAG: hypothetical protein AAF734_00170 [Bacteroidota bacterium]